MLQFVRIGSYRETLQKAASAEGYDDKYLAARPPSFANWRWSTLREVMEWFRPNLLPLHTVWDDSTFERCKSRKLEPSWAGCKTDAMDPILRI